MKSYRTLEAITYRDGGRVVSVVRNRVINLDDYTAEPLLATGKIALIDDTETDLVVDRPAELSEREISRTCAALLTGAILSTTSEQEAYRVGIGSGEDVYSVPALRPYTAEPVRRVLIVGAAITPHYTPGPGVLDGDVQSFPALTFADVTVHHCRSGAPAQTGNMLFFRRYTATGSGGAYIVDELVGRELRPGDSLWAEATPGATLDIVTKVL